ncbi:hypothetical protein NVP1084O_188 [Vibrio phage 1.084.O._10N.261.49.F5]|nr:hypothetical protein NVP1084O_188 [Vibrio phage 1.084.O._10N.261.49.F5]
MKFVPTHSSLDLNELVMIKDGVVYVQTDDFMDVESCGYAHEYNEAYLLPLEG